ncbi:hypothetical protein [Nonomuraea basaltis]|uniref:hypothetical protein n=1 Tax=Nonomuraea basaltis TaxID=2495887 RepID=UPI00110C63B7|nr:hypothetical protein [Nonomuraea basaltis]TMS00446.1 hypothetical protein EJK15_01990 [Nonomuraea basaltis]
MRLTGVALLGIEISIIALASAASAATGPEGQPATSSLYEAGLYHGPAPARHAAMMEALSDSLGLRMAEGWPLERLLAAREYPPAIPGDWPPAAPQNVGQPPAGIATQTPPESDMTAQAPSEPATALLPSPESGTTPRTSAESGTAAQTPSESGTALQTSPESGTVVQTRPESDGAAQAPSESDRATHGRLEPGTATEKRPPAGTAARTRSRKDVARSRTRAAGGRKAVANRAEVKALPRPMRTGAVRTPQTRHHPARKRARVDLTRVVPRQAAVPMSHATAAGWLKSAGLRTRSTGHCTSKHLHHCTSLDSVRTGTIARVIELKRESHCPIMVTGGTEAGHAPGHYSHGNGYKLDISHNPCIDRYITKNHDRAGVRSDGAPLYRSSSGTTFADESDHWDILFR